MKNATNIAMKNAPRFVDDTHVLVTKAFMKNARIFGTPEYKMWKEIKKDCEAAVMVPKTIKKNPNKRTSTKNMTYAHMEIFINQQDNAKELMIAFNKQKALSKIQNDPYRFVLAWFLKTFQNYDEDYKAFFAELSRKEAKKNDVLFSSDIVSEDMAEDFE